MIDREAVRDAARYLRQVRPIDPEEIADYVEGRSHPAVVRQTLREEAFDLGLVERPNGRFVPVDEEPVVPPGWEPRVFPDRYAAAFEDLLAAEYGHDWARGPEGDRLRAAIRRLKTDYYYDNKVEYDRDAAFGYGIYHLPDYYAAVGYVLDDLAERELLGRRLRVLDVGAGVGGPALGLADYLPDDALVAYHAVEPGPAADVLTALLDETGPNVHTRVHRTTIESFLNGGPAGEGDADRGEGADESENGNMDRGGDWDLVLFANVLSELDEPAAVVEAALDDLTAGGAVVALAPADRSTATGLRSVERAVASPNGPVTVYAPTLRLWPGTAPTDEGWSFDAAPELATPSFQRRLDAAADRGPEDEPGEFVTTDVKFAYAILRTDGRRRVKVRADPERHARLSDSADHVTDRIDLLATKLSRDLSEGGNPLYRIGDGSQREDHYAVLVRESSLNRGLREAAYGAVLSIENGLLLWNDDEAAYNLVIDEGSVVDVVG